MNVISVLYRLYKLCEERVSTDLRIISANQNITISFAVVQIVSNRYVEKHEFIIWSSCWFSVSVYWELTLQIIILCKTQYISFQYPGSYTGSSWKLLRTGMNFRKKVWFAKNLNLSLQLPLLKDIITWYLICCINS